MNYKLFTLSINCVYTIQWIVSRPPITEVIGGLDSIYRFNHRAREKILASENIWI